MFHYRLLDDFSRLRCGYPEAFNRTFADLCGITAETKRTNADLCGKARK
jgi:hypothetical protein